MGERASSPQPFEGEFRVQEQGLPEQGASQRTIGAEILVVDDDPPIRALVRQIIRRTGHEAVEARDGVEALEQIDQNLPRLIVLDLMMPRMDGWEVLEELRSRKILGRVPVLVLSAVATQRGESLAEYGVQGILGKPFEVGELMRMLRKILDETN